MLCTMEQHGLPDPAPLPPDAPPVSPRYDTETGQRLTDFPLALQLEVRAVDEVCRLVHWLFFVLDERLHAAVGQPLHAAWGQPHGCAPLSADESAAVERQLRGLSSAHTQLRQVPSTAALRALAFGSRASQWSHSVDLSHQEWLFGCGPPDEPTRMSLSQPNGGAPVRTPSPARPLPRSVAKLGSKLLEDAELQVGALQLESDCCGS